MTTQEKAKDRRLQKLFRITLDEHEKIEKYQKTTAPFKLLLGKKNGLDHDHASGKVRGLLDWRLNRALGLVESVNKEKAATILCAMATFLSNPPAKLALGRQPYGLIGQAKVKRKMIYGSENGPIPVPKKRKKP
jgi:Recombination endonuclease VII